MTLDQLSYMVLTILRGGSVVDDERLDKRLVKDWINMKRAQYIKNERKNNPNNRLNLSYYQTEELTITPGNVTDAGDYPYSDSTTQLYTIAQSGTIPSIIEDSSGPIVLSLETEDLMKLPFSLVSYDHLKFAGNGKFNSGIIFGAIRDNKVYFKTNTHFSTYDTVLLRAVFNDPREVTDYDDSTDTYPASEALIEYIKNGVLDLDIRMFLAARTDEVSDSSGEV